MSLLVHLNLSQFKVSLNTIQYLYSLYYTILVLVILHNTRTRYTVQYSYIFGDDYEENKHAIRSRREVKKIHAKVINNLEFVQFRWLDSLIIENALHKVYFLF